MQVNQAVTFSPGVFYGQPNAEYQATEAISKGRLDYVSKSPKHYYAKFLDPDREPEERTEALILGDAIHDTILSPDIFDSKFTTIPEDAPSRPSIRQINAKKPSPATVAAIDWWDNFQAKNAGKTFLKNEQLSLVRGVRDAVWTHPKARELLSGGEPEVSYYAHDPQTGAKIKARPDYLRLNSGMIVDVKTTEDASPDGFGRSANKYRYHVQGDWYPRVLNAHYQGDAIEYFVFLAVEKKPPFAIGIYWMEPEDFAEGRELGDRDLATILQCTASGFWPDYGDTPQPLRRPRRLRRFPQ